MDEINAPWNLVAMRDAVRCAHGQDVASKAFECAQSLTIRQDYIYYHYWEVKRLLDDDLNNADSITVARDYILGASSDKYDEFHWKRTRAEANLIALLQSVHASYDHLGHVIYFALNFDGDPLTRIDIDKISIHSVRRMLSACRLKEAVNAMLSDKTMKHVAALVNTSKHRNIVRAQISVSFIPDTQPHGLKFKAFEYGNTQYPERWAMPFVRSAYDAFQNHMRQVGISLHEQLGI